MSFVPGKETGSGNFSIKMVSVVGFTTPYTIHLQPCYQGLGYQEGRFKEAERAAREVLALPIYPELTEKQQELVVHTVEQFFKNSS